MKVVSAKAVLPSLGLDGLYLTFNCFGNCIFQICLNIRVAVILEREIHYVDFESEKHTESIRFSNAVFASRGWKKKGRQPLNPIWIRNFMHELRFNQPRV